MPVVYGVTDARRTSGPDVLLLERLRGVPVEAPTRTPARWEQLQEQIVEGLLAWHRQDSGGCVEWSTIPRKPVAELVPPAGRGYCGAP